MNFPALIAAVTFLALVALVLVGVRDQVHFSRLISKFREAARASAQAPTIATSIGPASRDLWSEADGFRALGFEWLAVSRSEAGEEITLFRPRDAVVAHVARVTSSELPGQPETNIRHDVWSSLTGHLGLLHTSNYERHVKLWAGELLQIFPEADTDQLIINHGSALAYLATLGIGSDHLAREEVADLREQLRRRWAAAAASAKRKDVLKLAIRFVRHDPPSIGPLQDQVDVAELLQAFRVQVATSPAG